MKNHIRKPEAHINYHSLPTEIESLKANIKFKSNIYQSSSHVNVVKKIGSEEKMVWKTKNCDLLDILTFIPMFCHDSLQTLQILYQTFL